MKRFQVILAIAIVLIITIIFSALILRKKVIERPEGLISQLKDLADLRLQSIHLTENLPSGGHWELTADTARYFKEGNYTILEKIQLFYSDRERGTMTLTSQRGQMSMESRNVEVSGNVVLTSDDGYVFRADYLKFVSKEKRIYTEGPVYLEGPGIKLRGTGMSLDLNTERVNIFKGVWSLIEVSDERQAKKGRGR
ncbi:MAG: LPS export ABC transporter periplasmic protein LptC [Candidatus Bathyarchaeia archaeon]